MRLAETQQRYYMWATLDPMLPLLPLVTYVQLLGRFMHGKLHTISPDLFDYQCHSLAGDLLHNGSWLYLSVLIGLKDPQISPLPDELLKVLSITLMALSSRGVYLISHFLNSNHSFHLFVN